MIRVWFLHLFTYFYHKSHPEALAHDQACAIALAQVPVHKAPPSLRQAAAESGVERKGNHSPIITLCYPSGGFNPLDGEKNMRIFV